MILKKSFLLIFFFLFLMTQSVTAEDINLKFEYNLDKEYKASDMIQLAITIDNYSKKDIDAILYIETNLYSENKAAYYQNVLIPKKTSKMVTLSIPFNALNFDSFIKLEQSNQILASVKIGKINIEKLDYYSYENYWPLKNAAVRIPTLNLPNLSMLVLFFIGYILLIGPIIYFVLKRKGKRENAWYIIPAISILITFVFYQVALLSRGDEVMSHNVSFLEIKDNSHAEISTVSSIFVPHSGDFSVIYDGINYIMPIDESNNDRKTWIKLNKDRAFVDYEDMDFWSYSSLYLKNNLYGIGSFESSLLLNNGKLTGTIYNNSILSLTDTKLLYGNIVYDLGDFTPFESKHIDISNINNTYQNHIDIDRLLPSNLANDPKRYQSRESAMLEMIYNKPTEDFTNELIIIGWTEEPFVQLEILENKQEDYNLTLIKDTLKLIENNDQQALLQPSGTSADGSVNN